MRVHREAGISEMISECAYETELGVEIGRSGSKNQYEKLRRRFKTKKSRLERAIFFQKKCSK